MVRLGCHQSYCTSWDLSVLKFFSKLYISIRTDMWQAPVDAAAKDTVTNHGKYSMPEEARSSTVWMNTLPASSEVAATQCDEEIWAVVCSAAVSRRLVLKRLADFPGSACLRKHAKSQPPDPTKRCELLLVPQHSVGNGTWSVLLICLAPRAWGNLAARKEISRVWLLNFLQFCATSRNMSTSQKKIMAAQKQGKAIFSTQLIQIVIVCEFSIACCCMLRRSIWKLCKSVMLLCISVFMRPGPRARAGRLLWITELDRSSVCTSWDLSVIFYFAVVDINLDWLTLPHWLTHSLIHSLTLIHSHSPSLTLTHFLRLLVTHSLTHSLTHHSLPLLTHSHMLIWAKWKIKVTSFPCLWAQAVCLGDNAALVVSGRIHVQETSGPQSPFDTHGVAPSQSQ